MQPFQHPDKGWIDSAYIRGTLGISLILVQVTHWSNAPLR